jgi:hypothetical protein
MSLITESSSQHSWWLKGGPVAISLDVRNPLNIKRPLRSRALSRVMKLRADGSDSQLSTRSPATGPILDWETLLKCTFVVHFEFWRATPDCGCCFTIHCALDGFLNAGNNLDFRLLRS